MPELNVQINTFASERPVILLVPLINSKVSDFFCELVRQLFMAVDEISEFVGYSLRDYQELFCFKENTPESGER